jgi:hypothetical protein
LYLENGSWKTAPKRFKDIDSVKEGLGELYVE